MRGNTEVYPSVIIVMLRRPRSDAKESRTDPYWEFGSFGTTGCHGRSVMSRARINEIEGKRLAFAQGGADGFRLVYITPPVSTRFLAKNGTCEARWAPAEMPLGYQASPCLVDNSGRTDFPLLIRQFRDVQRPTWVSKFASAFRTSRKPLAGIVGAELLRVYQMRRADCPEGIARTYVDALPYPPPSVEDDAKRQRDYQRKVRRC
jgi:hypothetical protein